MGDFSFLLRFGFSAVYYVICLIECFPVDDLQFWNILRTSIFRNYVACIPLVADNSDYTLTRYGSIYDVPYAKLDYKSYVEEDGDSGHYTLTKDGIPWVGTPGTDQFGDICFSDGRNLYIQCFLSYNDTLSTDFRWFCVNFNHFDDEDSHFLPDETMNKLFTGADGETLYTDDGYQYKLSTMPWCQDGTCKR